MQHTYMGTYAWPIGTEQQPAKDTTLYAGAAHTNHALAQSLVTVAAAVQKVTKIAACAP